MARSFVPWTVAGCLVLAGAAFAQQPAASDVAQLIEQLEGSEFAQRQAATQQLSALGKAAFDQLEQAVAGASRETSSRALDVLKGHFQRGDNEAKAAAQASLQRLAQSGNAAVAQRAQNVLNPPPAPSEQDIAILMRQAAPVGIANLQVQIANVRAGARSITTSRNGNGDVKIQVRENGKTTKIERAAGGKIDVEITEPQNGKEVTRAFEVKDLDALKKKDAEAARLFEQYNRPLPIQVGGFGPAGAIVPNAFPVPAFPAVPPLPVAAQQAELQKRLLESIEAQIQQRKAQSNNGPTAQRAIESLERMKEQVKQRLGEAAPAAGQPAARPAQAAAEAKAAGGQ